MNYEFFESLEATETTEMLEDGILLEHFSGKINDIEYTDNSELYGNPAKDASVWEKAESNNSDSLLCEKYVAKLLIDNELTEQELCALAGAMGVYNSEYGYTQYDVGKYLEEINIDVIRESSLTINDICESLDNNEKVICAISSISLYFPEISYMPGLSADSFIEIIGIDMSDSTDKRVIANCPFEDMGAVEFSLDEFVKAWQKSDCYAVIAGKNLRGEEIWI